MTIPKIDLLSFEERYWKETLDLEFENSVRGQIFVEPMAVCIMQASNFFMFSPALVDDLRSELAPDGYQYVGKVSYDEKTLDVFCSKL
jgi:hypothetical protein